MNPLKDATARYTCVSDEELTVMESSGNVAHYAPG